MKNYVKKYRLELGLSQADLAKAVGTSQQQIHRIENGLHRIDLQTATQICVKLNRKLEEVFPTEEKNDDSNSTDT
jgi:DNA-binding XRE family transcriptional regulator